ncbi:hypothetical protein [Sulfurivirga sp.]|uniref:hypothetical protein n=1 Tax=Sulfurivirga sp. TaxID=2614236 RepID=UPI0025D03479|nr:hypothetical protein [Sulfurivirga sp.]
MNARHSDCARARLLVSDLTQILRDTAHTLQAHHNVAAADWLLGMLDQLERHRQTVQQLCVDAPLLPPWEAPALSSLNAFMDGVDMHAAPSTLASLLRKVIDELTAWYDSTPSLPGKERLIAQLRALEWPDAPENGMLHGDPLAPVNEEGS